MNLTKEQAEAIVMACRGDRVKIVHVDIKDPNVKHGAVATFEWQGIQVKKTFSCCTPPILGRPSFGLEQKAREAERDIALIIAERTASAAVS